MHRENSKTRNKMMILLAFGITLITLLICLCNKNIIIWLDDTVLLEKRNPGYYKYFNVPQTHIVLREIVDKGSENLIINNLVSKTYEEGFTIIIHDNGSFTYSGINNSKNTYYIEISDEQWNLQDGTYILSDSAGENVVSNENIFLYCEGHTYLIGGEMKYSVVANMAGGNQTFVINHEQFAEYGVFLAIKPQYYSDGITFYPMVRKETIRNQRYQPCMILNRKASAEATYTYDVYNIRKEDYLSLSNEDLKLLEHKLKFQSSADWTTIDFQDGTGIEYPEGEKEQKIYGMIDRMGRITTSMGGTEEIKSPNLQLGEIRNIISYLEKLNNPEYTILVSVKDEGVEALTPDIQEKLRDLGSNIDLSAINKDGRKNYYRNSYYAVFNPSRGAVEEVGENELTYTGVTLDGLQQFTIHSAGSRTENSNASILMNGIETSMNLRGMNFVVYSNKLGKVVDQVTFDTHSGLKAFRPFVSQ